ncbi:MAG: 50S ribosomal protein L27 [Patescibacteria group bacterium]|jgi:large subunit ribosomal protein L27|nr:50S ribosomal protein L27 [Patescibacteria group bacterium]MDD5173024.1 50S ribosomal protein L27 [Patescibacteria group bacterium]
MAHKKQGGSTSLGRDSQAKRLGLKVGSGQKVWPGIIILRQRGTKIHPGIGVRRGKDDTLYAVTEGQISFTTKKVKKFDGHLVKRKFVNVILKK